MTWTQATARCPDGHDWPCRWRTESKAKPSGITTHRRVVEPETCPTCAQRWQRVERAGEARA